MRSGFIVSKGKSMRAIGHRVLICSLLVCAIATGRAQTASPVPSSAATAQPDLLRQRMEAISTALAAAQEQIEQSQRQMQQLRLEFLELRGQVEAAGTKSPASAESISAGPTTSVSTSISPTTTLEASSSSLAERVQILEAAVKVHDQTKVESSSKYPVRITGLILFNGYLNRGATDNADLPSFAVRGTPTSGNGNLGAGLRQSILGVEGYGPRIAGARTSANASLDFFSSISYSSYGTSAGIVRMRTASIDLDWEHNAVQVGIVTPLISPLSPTSFATVAEPSLAGAGNLWTWAPQLRFTHQVPLREGKRLQIEAGLWDSPAAGYNPNQLVRIPSPAELAQQPAYETRVSYSGGGERGYQLGVSGYYSRQAYPGFQGNSGTAHLDSWASTVDWRVPLLHHFEISGEGYRGRSIAGLGGGLYKDFVVGTSPTTGATPLHGLNAIGGWAQLKTLLGSSLESNISIGQDNGFARDFHVLVLPAGASATQLRARNKMLVANMIYRPKRYIISFAGVPQDLELAHRRCRHHVRCLYIFGGISILEKEAGQWESRNTGSLSTRYSPSPLLLLCMLRPNA